MEVLIYSRVYSETLFNCTGYKTWNGRMVMNNE